MNDCVTITSTIAVGIVLGAALAGFAAGALVTFPLTMLYVYKKGSQFIRERNERCEDTSDST